MVSIKKAVFREIENNMFIIQFFHWRDKEKVLNGRPWCFDQNLLILQELDSSVQPSDIVLNTSPFWVRIYNMPFDCRTVDNVRRLAGKLGEVLEIEDDVIGWDRSMRVRVLLNVQNPIRRYQKIKNKKGEICSVEFKYEGLPFFCFKCGIMGHLEKDCQLEESDGDDRGRQWGAWLRACLRKGVAVKEEEIQQISKGKKTLTFYPKPTEDLTRGRKKSKEIHDLNDDPSQGKNISAEDCDGSVLEQNNNTESGDDRETIGENDGIVNNENVHQQRGESHNEATPCQGKHNVSTGPKKWKRANKARVVRGDEKEESQAMLERKRRCGDPMEIDEMGKKQKIVEINVQGVDLLNQDGTTGFSCGVAVDGDNYHREQP